MADRTGERFGKDLLTNFYPNRRKGPAYLTEPRISSTLHESFLKRGFSERKRH
jgi:hypothetical protein